MEKIIAGIIWNKDIEFTTSEEVLPLQPLPIHIRSLSTNVWLKCPLQHRCPVQIAPILIHCVFILFNHHLTFLKTTKGCTDLLFPLSKFGTKIRPITRGIEWFPPENNKSALTSVTNGIVTIPEIVKVVWVCTSKETFKSKCLRSSALRDWSVKELLKAANKGH